MLKIKFLDALGCDFKGLKMKGDRIPFIRGWQHYLPGFDCVSLPIKERDYLPGFDCVSLPIKHVIIHQRGTAHSLGGEGKRRNRHRLS